MRLSVLRWAPKGSCESRARYGRSHAAYCWENMDQLKGSRPLPQYLLQAGYERAVASSGVTTEVPLLVRSNERAVAFEIFNAAQAWPFVLLAQPITSAKHCEKSTAVELTAYNASRTSKSWTKKVNRIDVAWRGGKYLSDGIMT